MSQKSKRMGNVSCPPRTLGSDLYTLPPSRTSWAATSVPWFPANSPVLDISMKQVDEYLTCVWDICLICSAERDADTSEQITEFHSVAVPNVALGDYVDRLLRRLSYDGRTTLTALVLAKRYWAHHLPSTLAAHRLFATLILVASKLNNDRVWRNSDFAVNCGLSLRELNRLEVSLLKELDHAIFVSEADVLSLVWSLDKAIMKHSFRDACAAFGVQQVKSTAAATLSRAISFFDQCSACTTHSEAPRDDDRSSADDLAIAQGSSRTGILMLRSCSRSTSELERSTDAPSSR